MRKIAAYFILFLTFCSGLIFFQNCSKTNFSEASADSGSTSLGVSSCDMSKRPSSRQRSLSCPSGVGSITQTIHPVCTPQNLWAAGAWQPSPVNFSACGCPVTGQVVNGSTGLCSCPAGEYVITTAEGTKCGKTTCVIPPEPAREDSMACPYNASSKILRNRQNTLVGCVWQPGSWSDWNSSQCTCPVAGQTGVFDPNTRLYTCSCPAGNVILSGKCVQPPACDPLNSNSRTSCDKRLKAKLYFQPGSPTYSDGWSDVNMYLQSGHYVGEIFFSDLFIPTRSFSTGFPGVDQRTEFFALDITTKLQVSSEMPAGNYQLGIISDDGSIVSYTNSSNQEIELVNQNTYTSSKLGCANQSVTLSNNQKIDLRVRYFQGPQTAIGLVLMYRPWSQSALNTPISCGFISDSLFGAFPVPVRTNGDRSYPGTSYEQLIDQGWKPIPSSSFSPLVE